jgi:uncharacterized membrane protein
VRALIGFRKNRLEALQDGIFAVALTLLAIDLRVPLGLAGPDVRAHLLGLLPALAVYATTFAFIGVVWLFVYSYQELVLRQDIAGSTLVLTASACVALLPFTSSTFAQYPREQIAGHFFVLNIIAIVLAYAVYIEYANRRLIPHTVEHRLLRTVALIVWMCVVYIALVDVLVAPYLPAWILPAVIAGFLYAYVCVFALHRRFAAEQEHVRSLQREDDTDVTFRPGAPS